MLFDREAQKYYHAPPMSAQAVPAVIDSLEFARTGQSLMGSLPVSALARLQDRLVDGLGEVRFEVRGGQDARRRPVLALKISGVLHLQCQRCLGALDYALQHSSTLLLVSGSGASSSDLEEVTAEWIEASNELDLAGLVEDEILLALPYAPRHGEGLCPPGVIAAGSEKVTAFAKLAVLKRNGH